MADLADIAQEQAELEESMRPPRKPYELPAGGSGECEHCGYLSRRLVDGLCAPCRDLLRIP